ncbi:D-alanine--D-alanine ligase family protein [Oribacterium sp. WCC10]|uniref:D-alanine--D-alanine ligase family protein n=1 Tax=Oribacterium sp. WCC10 TaxID=1855343 RepID=UPI0008E66988|nr:D-alanine--D-alanine ligase family protein [Oribacterium sp. WCC10]SFG26949.1 D-alanine-D-alanine ligase [Oribacterium sp. WCC10]
MKKTLLAVFGGRSTEHEVSCKSVVNIVKNIDRDKYDILLVGITKQGEWLLADSLDEITDGSWYESKTRACLLPDAMLKSLMITDENGNTSLRKIDVIFPALHGKNGEDGTIQGLFEMAQIPYVGCGVLASAVSMDKLYTKIVCNEPLKAIGVRQAGYVSVVGKEIEDMDECVRRVESAFSYPVFVKPSNAGSSCGVTKAHDRNELIEGLKKAYEVDYKILIEETITGREVECAVFKDCDGNIKASGVGEIKAAADFYDYDAKYNNPQSETDTAPDIAEADVELIRKAAKTVFSAVDGFSLARIDFFLTENGPVFNELNTLPGFTAISMYPMLWEVKGVDKKKLIQDLIDTAFTRPTLDK